MQCLCGFDQEIEENKIYCTDTRFKDCNLFNYKESFTEIEGTFMIRDSYKDLRRVELWACPKCNTIRMRK